MKYNLLLLLVLIFYAEITAQQITVTRTRDNITYGMATTDYFIDAEVSGLPVRKVRVRGFRQSPSKGTVVLTSGGKGTAYYSSSFGTEAQEMIKCLYDEGLEIFEIRYDGADGWAEFCEGIGGYEYAVEIYTELVRFFRTEYFENKDLLMATGNSGGSFQISYGLAAYELDEIMDMVVLTGGPPTVDLRRAIFGEVNDPARWRNTNGGQILTDFLMGWTEEKYCLSRMAPDSIIDLLDDVSIVGSSRSRSYSYNTMVNFVQSDDPSNSHEQARIFYDAIQSDKAWYDVPVRIHAVPSSPEGAGKIKEVILNYVDQITSIDDTRSTKSPMVGPNPSWGKVGVYNLNPTILSRIQVADGMGKIILEKCVQNSQEVRLKITSGHYNVIIYSDDKTPPFIYPIIVIDQ